MNIDDLIDKWHDSDSDKELYEFLNMSKEEYEAWVMRGEQ